MESKKTILKNLETKCNNILNDCYADSRNNKLEETTIKSYDIKNILHNKSKEILATVTAKNNIKEYLHNDFTSVINNNVYRDQNYLDDIDITTYKYHNLDYDKKVAKYLESEKEVEYLNNLETMSKFKDNYIEY